MTIDIPHCSFCHLVKTIKNLFLNIDQCTYPTSTTCLGIKIEFDLKLVKIGPDHLI